MFTRVYDLQLFVHTQLHVGNCFSVGQLHDQKMLWNPKREGGHHREEEQRRKTGRGGGLVLGGFRCAHLAEATTKLQLATAAFVPQLVPFIAESGVLPSWAITLLPIHLWLVRPVLYFQVTI